MSLGRLALRLAAVETLMPFAAIQATGPWPTVAGPNVFDSRVDPVAQPDEWETFLTRIDGQPLVVVYSEEHETEPEEPAKFIQGARCDIVELVCELMIAARGEIVVEGPAGPQTIGALTAGATDRQREAVLDLFEAQVRMLFDPVSVFQGASAPNTIFKRVCWELRHVHSVPQRETNGQAKIAARTVKFKCKIAMDEWPQPGSPAQAGPYAALPDPLYSIANLLSAGSSGADLCAALAGLIGSQAVPPNLAQVVLGPLWTRTFPPTFAPPTPATVAAGNAPADMTGQWSGPAENSDLSEDFA